MAIMESLSILLSSSPPIQNNPKTLKPATTSKSNSHLSKFTFAKEPSLQNPLSLVSNKTTFSFTTIQLFTSLPCLASEALTSQTEQVSDKINLESILVSIDDFFNKNPFFVAGCTFIWLVVIPLTKEYLRKYKFVSAIDAFRKLRDNPDAQLLDIRDRRSVVALGSPNLKMFNKSVVQVEFSEGDEGGFVKNVLKNFQDPANTILCILDNFDGDSMRVAELLFKNGFKEAYAIRGGVRGKKGWLEIQETLLPPSVHMKPKKKKKKAKVSQLGVNGGVAHKNDGEDGIPSSISFPLEASQSVDNGHVNKPMTSTHVEIDFRSPYPNYPDLKPPSSPMLSKS
ncbi:PREDICTED: rhodanese-like domain-containing protein 4A, chloroplastic isoform X2 [Populus euphratica]|uniref:Rhodanese-like domain-containing protein 4A, chloroplastic isoform X2 n=1 Tax=Populus euphratica TaxID=75702 RepID=A0AAJ6TQ99_POPEU|nr:PREDICTED: rhodanese-like domain-containing protein 4A, chloroplastic isoform X2 [Populus euphratica]